MKEATKRATVYFDEEVHRALRLKSAESDLSISELVNDAVKYLLAEDAVDLEAFESTKKEPSLKFENVVKKLRARGKI